MSNRARRTPRQKPTDFLPDAELRRALIRWAPQQRWCASDAAWDGLTLVDRVVLIDTAELGVELVIFRSADRDDGGYQLMVGRRFDLPENLHHVLIDQSTDAFFYDALHDPEVSGRLLRLCLDSGTLGPISATWAGPHDLNPDELPGLVMTAEQSNTSVVYGNKIVVKFFRYLVPGTNPDAQVTRALADSGVSTAYRGEMTVPVQGTATTLALATDFVSNAADAWSLALASVRDLLAEEDLHPDEVGGDFAAEAHRLGAAIAHLHERLATTLPTPAPRATPATAQELAERVVANARGVGADVPEFVPLVDAVISRCRELAAAADSAAWPLQRIHGDLHLGQVLRTVTGWLVFDFEGEPRTSIVERTRPRSPLRDVAGMLRSLDYASKYQLFTGERDARILYRTGEWLRRNRDAFLGGYTETSGKDPREAAALLGLFELDKAIYETGYEHRHRPQWLEIPLGAIRALIDDEG